jgi:hypothetical protein
MRVSADAEAVPTAGCASGRLRQRQRQRRVSRRFSAPSRELIIINYQLGLRECLKTQFS